MPSYRLLSVNADAKTRKGVKRGYLTGVLYLAPADSSGLGFTICGGASEACIRACLNYSGRSRFMATIQAARIRKTRELFACREAFCTQIERDILALLREAKRKRLIPAVRLNGTSDLPWLALRLAARFPKVQFYDYTKLGRSWERQRANYHLTFSWSGSNREACLEAMVYGMNVAVPFDVPKGKPLPKTWMGRRVIDGDLSDLRFLDKRNVIVGLRVKTVSRDRREQGIAGGFVVSILPAPKFGVAA